jgi:hypothetical protein
MVAIIVAEKIGAGRSVKDSLTVAKASLRDEVRTLFVRADETVLRPAMRQECHSRNRPKTDETHKRLDETKR